MTAMTTVIAGRGRAADKPTLVGSPDKALYEVEIFAAWQGFRVGETGYLTGDGVQALEDASLLSIVDTTAGAGSTPRPVGLRLEDLADVSKEEPLAGYAPVWNETAERWEPGNPDAAASAATDAEVSTALAGHDADAEAHPALPSGVTIAKQTATTPAGSPGLYALNAAAAAESGWVDIQLDAENAILSTAVRTADAMVAWLSVWRAEDDSSATAVMGVQNTAIGENGYINMVLDRDDGVSLQLHGATTGQNNRYFEVYDPAGVVMFYIAEDGSATFLRDVYAIAGVVLKAPNGSFHRVTVANDGTLSTVPA